MRHMTGHYVLGGRRSVITFPFLLQRTKARMNRHLTFFTDSDDFR